MIGYVMLGTDDLERAAQFYDAVLAEIGAKRTYENAFIQWEAPSGETTFCVTKPYDGNAATLGNGAMIALKARSEEQVNALHAKALELGGTDEGAPGPRGTGGFYGGYFRDLDGNRLAFYIM
jgi:predicted lactoylglutathione lyase